MEQQPTTEAPAQPVAQNPEFQSAAMKHTNMINTYIQEIGALR